MTWIDDEGAEVVNDLLLIVAEEFDEEIQPDHILYYHCGHVFDAVMAAVQYLYRNGHAPPFEAIDLLVRFFQIAERERPM